MELTRKPHLRLAAKALRESYKPSAPLDYMRTQENTMNHCNHCNVRIFISNSNSNSNSCYF